MLHVLAFAVDRLREIWPAVTKVGRWSDKAMQLDVGGVACIVTSERKSFLWNVEQLAPSAKLGLHVFLQVLSGENVTTFGAGWVAVGDTLEVGHWMLFGFARLRGVS